MTIIRRTTPGYPGTYFGWGLTDRDFGLPVNEMTRLFENFFKRGYLATSRRAFPPVNLYEDNENFYMTAELPGMTEKDIEINVEADSIRLKGERKIVSDECKNVCYHRRERAGGAFNKKVNLRNRISTDKVTANMNNGVLKITMPKTEDSKPKKIEVKVN
ncbi:Hsp20/alpha crystallin family protein [Desulfonema magnum]|uniref:Heat shock protein, Hsp 20 family n=1 Tax=Desulfonema magnum TaxID=45655 RepID=A0A975BR82_9BACT|nr:Hsp20/alpha crystallin family protein [Desulfonema magnum]QTA90156.1 Heat shock protein, Hsp 20 family [Desulfonema magnum]